MQNNEETLDELENRLAQLRRALRLAMVERDAARAAQLRQQLRRAESLWEDKAAAEQPVSAADTSDASAPARPGAPVPEPALAALLPTREQVHQTLSLLEVPAAPKLIIAVHEAFFPGELPASRLASLRRDEERSYRSAPNARPYYLCPALTADRLAPARALLTVSTWPLERRIMGAHSPRVDFLTTATKIASALISYSQLGPRWTPDAQTRAERLLRSFAISIPGALGPPTLAGHVPALDPDQVGDAAKAELSVHLEVDRRQRSEAAIWARDRLSEAERLFGNRLASVRNSASAD